MAIDDGKTVAIAEQSVVRWVIPPDIAYVHYVRVCNKTGEAKSVYIESKPYRFVNGKKVKTGESEGEYKTIGANQCEWVVFSFDTKPDQYYTDVYPAAGLLINYLRRYHFKADMPPKKLETVICLASYRPVGMWHTVGIPYPRSLEVSEGRPLAFQVTGIRGLRDDWELLSTYPELGEPFELEPNQKNFPFTFEIAVHGRVPAETITDVSIDVSVVDQEAAPPYAWTIGVPMVNKSEPPALVSLEEQIHPQLPHLVLECEVEDSMGLVDAPAIRYSEDDGLTWAMWGSRLVDVGKWSKYGIESARFEIQIPLKSRTSSILASLILRDTVGNELPLPVTRYPQSGEQHDAK